MRWSPETRVGRLALTLAGLAFAGIVAIVVAFALGMDNAESFTDNWLLAAWGAAIIVSAAACVVAGTLAFVREHERSWLVLGAALLGLLLTGVALEEVIQGLA